MKEIVILSSFIPAWLVGLVMIYTGIVWFLYRGKQIRVSSDLFGPVFIFWGLIFTTFQFIAVPIELRAFISRIMIIIVCLSQAIPLSVIYIRNKRSK